MTEFSEEKYWLTHGRTYFDMFRRHKVLKRLRFRQQEKELERILKATVFADGKVGSILEVGCGFGRITKFLLKNPRIQRIEAFDLSPEQIENAKKYVKDSRVNFRVSNVMEYPFSPESFDLVIATEVLMHIPHEDVAGIVRRMCLSSKEYVASLDADWYSGKLEEHCFNHSYVDIYRKVLTRNDTITRFALRDHPIAKILKSVRIRQSLYVLTKKA